MARYTVVPHVSRTSLHPHPHVSNHTIESTHVDMWAVVDNVTSKVIETHWHKESCESVAKWHEQSVCGRGAHPCSGVVTKE